MNTFVEHMINSTSAQSRARLIEKKEILRKEIFVKTGWMPSKELSIKNMLTVIS